jgi:hypothetical protein
MFPSQRNVANVVVSVQKRTVDFDMPVDEFGQCAVIQVHRTSQRLNVPDADSS